MIIDQMKVINHWYGMLESYASNDPYESDKGTKYFTVAVGETSGRTLLYIVDDLVLQYKEETLQELCVEFTIVDEEDCHFLFRLKGSDLSGDALKELRSYIVHTTDGHVSDNVTEAFISKVGVDGTLAGLCVGYENSVPFLKEK